MSSDTGVPPLSRLTLGTMRLGDVREEGGASHLLSHARDIGISSFHCSKEYESFPLFAAAWRDAGLGSRSSALIGKIASPHFGEDRFSAATVRAKVESYCRDLRVERLDIVQWLLRHDLKNEAARLNILREAADDIAELAAALKQEGKIAAFVGFPYTPAIGEELVAAAWCDGIAAYVNPLEHDLDATVNACANAGKVALAIRPYAAGRIFSEAGMTTDAALRYVFGYPAVRTAIVSASSTAHLDVLRPWLSE